jgi:hypothetical protein
LAKDNRYACDFARLWTRVLTETRASSCADAFVHRRGGGFLAGDVRWIELKRDDTAFMALIDQVIGPGTATAPPASPSCEFCRYSAAA